MKNLDFECMKTAQEMIGSRGNKTEKENLATKGLGVLLENGPYGLILYLKTKNKTKNNDEYINKLFKLCEKLKLCNSSANDEFVKLQTLAKNLDKYLFIKKLWQQTLTYARYHAKALPDDENDTQSGESK